MPPNSKAMTPHITCINTPYFLYGGACGPRAARSSIHFCSLAMAPPHIFALRLCLICLKMRHVVLTSPNFLLYKLQSSLQHGIYEDDDIAIFTTANKLQRCISFVFCFYMRAWINLPGLS